MIKVVCAKEKKLPDGLMTLREVDIVLSPDEAKKENLEAFGKRVEKALNEKPYHVEKLNGFSIQTVHVNEAKRIMTVVFSDGTKQIVKCSPEDSFDTEIGFALAIVRRLFNSKSQVRKFIANNAKVIKVPEPVKPKRTRRPRKPKVVEESPKEE